MTNDADHPARRGIQMPTPKTSVAMCVNYRFTRNDGGLIPPEQRQKLDDELFELIGTFAMENNLIVNGQALFELPARPPTRGNP